MDNKLIELKNKRHELDKEISLLESKTKEIANFPIFGKNVFINGLWDFDKKDNIYEIRNSNAHCYEQFILSCKRINVNIDELRSKQNSSFSYVFDSINLYVSCELSSYIVISSNKVEDLIKFVNSESINLNFHKKILLIENYEKEIERNKKLLIEFTAIKNKCLDMFNGA